MKCIVFGDNHDDAAGLDRIPIDDAIYLHLGDLCGGDPDSARKSIDKVRELNAYCVLGSHDRSVVDDAALHRWETLAEKMNSLGNVRAAELFLRFFDDGCLLRGSLEREYLDFIRNLPETVELDLDGTKITAVHDSLVNGGNRRILTKDSARANFEAGDFDILFHGHTHTPSMYQQSAQRVGIAEKFFKLGDRHTTTPRESRFILNPGSVFATRGYPLVNKDSILFEEGSQAGPTGIVTFKYGSYGVFDTDTTTFQVVFFEK